MTETTASANWAPGSTVGAYTLLAKLATGGMAEIWLARQVGLRGFARLVVVKRILESFSNDEAFVEMFLDEARIVVQLTHPNIVQVFDLGEHAGAYYIAMEYLPGENLVAVARAAAKAGQPLSHATSVKIAIAALEGLAHAHTRTALDGKPLNIVHRDVSPHNIVLTWDGQVKLVDFGIARAANRSTQTQGNQLKGKFAYMAPEQARGDRELDGRVDVFAMGVVLWELVTRKRLFTVDDQVMILRSLISDAPVETARERSPDVPEALSDLIARALDKDPDTRFHSALEFKAALEDWLRSVGGGPTTAELAAQLHTLFEKKIAERSQLIENAVHGELPSPSKVEVMKPITDRSMPGGTPANVSPLKATALHVARAAPSATAVAPATRVSAPPEEAPAAAEAPATAVGQAPPTSDGWKLGVAAAATLLLVLIAAFAAWKVFLVEPSPPEPAVVEAPPAPVTPPTPAADPVAPAVPVVPTTIEKNSSLVVETEPPGAHVFVDGVDAGIAPLTVPDVTAGEHVVEATLAGYGPVKRTVSASAEGDRLMVVLTLPQRKAAEAARGRLTLSTEPWTHVSLNGKALGDTPLVEVPLPAGRHRLQLTNEQSKIDVAIEVEVKAGQLTKKSLRL